MHEKFPTAQQEIDDQMREKMRHTGYANDPEMGDMIHGANSLASSTYMENHAAELQNAYVHMSRTNDSLEVILVKLRGEIPDDPHTSMDQPDPDCLFASLTANVDNIHREQGRFASLTDELSGLI
jgi:hypothetical protein